MEKNEKRSPWHAKDVMSYFACGVLFIVIASGLVIFFPLTNSILTFSLFLLGIGVTYFGISFQFKDNHEMDAKLEDISNKLVMIENHFTEKET